MFEHWFNLPLAVAIEGNSIEGEHGERKPKLTKHSWLMIRHGTCASLF